MKQSRRRSVWHEKESGHQVPMHACRPQIPHAPDLIRSQYVGSLAGGGGAGWGAGAGCVVGGGVGVVGAGVGIVGAGVGWVVVGAWPSVIGSTGPGSTGSVPPGSIPPFQPHVPPSEKPSVGSR